MRSRPYLRMLSCIEEKRLVRQLLRPAREGDGSARDRLLNLVSPLRAARLLDEWGIPNDGVQINNLGQLAIG